MLNLIDRYITKLFIAYFLGGLLVFVTIFLAVDFMGFALRHTEAGFMVLVQYYMYYLPAIVYQMIPVGALLATIFTLSALNRSNELVALFSVGMSLARVSAPILVLVALVSGFSFWLGDRVLPNFSQKKNYVYYVEILDRPSLYSTVNSDRIWYRAQNVLFNIKTLNVESSLAFGMTLYYFDEHWNLTQLLTARAVGFKGSLWELEDGTVTLFAEESSFPLTQTFKKKTIHMNEDLGDIQTSANSSELMTLTELRRFISRNKEAGLDTVRYEVDYHSKYSFAFAAFVMSLMGIPFSVSRQRSGGAFLNVGLCIGLAFLYWVLYSSSLTLGQHGVLRPFWAAWSANLVVLALSVVLILRLKK